jgi:hypothetical protein
MLERLHALTRTPLALKGAPSRRHDVRVIGDPERWPSFLKGSFIVKLE